MHTGSKKRKQQSAAYLAGNYKYVNSRLFMPQLGYFERNFKSKPRRYLHATFPPRYRNVVLRLVVSNVAVTVP